MANRQTKRILFPGIFLLILLFPIITFGQSVDNLINKSVDYHNKGNYPKCLTEAQKAVSLAEKNAGKDPLIYYKALLNLSGAYYANKLLLKSEQTLVLLNKVCNQKFGPEDEFSQYYFEHLFNFYGNYEPAAKKNTAQKKLLIEKINELKKAKVNQTDFAEKLNVKLAKIYFEEKNYERAIKIYENLIFDTLLNPNKIEPKQYNHTLPGSPFFGQEHNENKEETKKKTNKVKLEYLKALETCYSINGNFEKTISINTKIIKHYLGKDEKERKLYTLEILDALNKLESIYSLLGKIPELKNTLELRISFIESFNEKMWDTYLASVLQLAKLQISTGEYDKALILFSTIKDYFEFEPELQNKMKLQQAIVYHQLGQKEKATDRLSSVLNECSKHREHQSACLNLFLYYPELVKDSTAKILIPAILESIRKELNETEKIAGKNHWLTFDLRNKIAEAYQLSGRFREAIEIQTILAKQWESLLGPENPKTINACYRLSQLYQRTGQNKLAIKEANKALQWMKKNSSLYIAPIQGIYSHVSNLYEKNKQVLKAYQIYHDGLENNYQKINRYFPVLTEKEKEDLIQSMEIDFQIYESFSIFYKDSLKALNQNLYNLCLNRKGLILHSQIQRDKIITESGHTELQALQKSAESIAKKILKNKNQADSSLAKETIELQKMLEEEERKIGAILTENESTRIVGNKNWQQIQEKLKQDEVAIEFIDYRAYNDSTRKKIAALLIRKESEEPILINLCDEKDLADFLRQEESKDYFHIKNKYGTQLNPNNTLYNKIIKPIEIHLNNIRKIYFSPTGILNKVSFGALFIDDKEMLIDRYEIEQLHTTGQLLLSANKNLEINDEFLLAGGIVYNSDSSKTLPWSFLPGSLYETDKIEKLLSIDSIPVQYVSRYSATENEIKKNISGKEIIHLATHGFYFPNPGNRDSNLAVKSGKLEETMHNFRNTKLYADWNFIHNPDPLMRSGLVLAMANETWQSNSSPAGEDGILTAKEISLMNLSDAKLVVLSACKTALGDNEKEEGVYGLQRALKMAGASHLLISLWEVPDQETAEFMEIFYRELLQGSDIPTAFANTRKDRRKKNYDPYYWGAFALIR